MAIEAEAAAAAGGGQINQNHNPPFFFYYNPLPTTTTTTFDMSEPPPLYQPTPTDSGLTFNHNHINNDNTSSGKRSRDYYSYSIPSPVSQRPRLSSLLESEAAALHFHHNHADFDSLIAHHTQRLKVELEEQAKQRSKVLVSAVREAVAARLREKDEEIERVARFNLALQERIRNLCVENNLWRGLAQTSEAAANSLRTDLERVLTSPSLVEDQKPDDNDDAGSCCGSSNGGTADDDEGVAERRAPGCKGGCGGEREAGVLVMPCRHLCLCTTCGSRRESCPVCGSAITASVHVNFSPS